MMKHIDIITNNDVNPLGTSIKVRNRLRKSIKRLHQYDVWAYRRFINYISRINEITEDNIHVGFGPIYILKIIINALNPKRILVPLPVQSALWALIEDFNLHIEPFNAGLPKNKIYNFDELYNIFNKEDLILFSNPHYLTGKIIDYNQWDELIKLLEIKNAFIVVDESLIDYTDIITPVKRIISSKNLLILRTFSNFFALPGMPFGYTLGNEETIIKLKELSMFDWKSITPLAYIGALTALKDKYYKKRTMEYLTNEKQYIKDKLKAYKTIEIFDPNCNFLLIRFNFDKIFLENELKKRNIFLEVFNDPNGFFLRLPLQKHKYNAYIVKVLRQILQNNGIEDG